MYPFRFNNKNNTSKTQPSFIRNPSTLHRQNSSNQYGQPFPTVGQMSQQSQSQSEQARLARPTTSTTEYVNIGGMLVPKQPFLISQRIRSPFQFQPAAAAQTTTTPSSSSSNANSWLFNDNCNYESCLDGFSEQDFLGNDPKTVQLRNLLMYKYEPKGEKLKRIKANLIGRYGNSSNAKPSTIPDPSIPQNWPSFRQSMPGAQQDYFSNTNSMQHQQNFQLQNAGNSSWLERIDTINQMRPSLVESSRIEFPDPSYFRILETLKSHDRKHEQDSSLNARCQSYLSSQSGNRISAGTSSVFSGTSTTNSAEFQMKKREAFNLGLNDLFAAKRSRDNRESNWKRLDMRNPSVYSALLINDQNQQQSQQLQQSQSRNYSNSNSEVEMRNWFENSPRYSSNSIQSTDSTVSYNRIVIPEREQRKPGPPIRNGSPSWTNLIASSSRRNTSNVAGPPVVDSNNNYNRNQSNYRIHPAAMPSLLEENEDDSQLEYVEPMRNEGALQISTHLGFDEMDEESAIRNGALFNAIRQRSGTTQQRTISDFPATYPERRRYVLERLTPSLNPIVHQELPSDELITTILPPPETRYSTSSTITSRPIPSEFVNEENDFEIPITVPRSSRRSRSIRSKFKEGPKLGMRSGVILTNPEYFCKPAVCELDLIAQSYTTCYVDNFEIGHVQWGTIMFPGRIDVLGLDIDSTVKFERGLVTLYRRKSLLQKVDLCELPAIVTYEKLEADDDSISLKEFIDHLKQTCRRINAEFISYDSERKVLKFKVARIGNGPRI